ncbi:MAG: metalloregulator ArsR/SmtB family transcription factor [Polyangiaceae bacterium]
MGRESTSLFAAKREDDHLASARRSLGGERPARQLAAPFDMTFAAISQHLRVLEEAGLVEVRRDGRQRLYRLRPQPLSGVVSWIDEFAAFFSERLDALGEHLDRKHGKRR